MRFLAPFWRGKRRLIAGSGLLFIFGAMFLLASTTHRLLNVRRAYRAFYSVENNQIVWTPSGKNWWGLRSALNGLRAFYLLDRPAPDWGYLVYVRWFRNAVLTVSWTPDDNSTLVVYRPDPKKPVSFNEVAKTLASQERGDWLGRLWRREFREPSPVWMRLVTTESSPSRAYPPAAPFQSASAVTFPDQPGLYGLKTTVIVGAETWTLLAFGSSPPSLARLQEVRNKLKLPVSPKARVLFDNDLARLRPTAEKNARESIGLALAMNRWGTAFSMWRHLDRDQKQDISFYQAFGTSMRLHGKYVQAAEGFERILEFSPNDPGAWRNMGDNMLLAHRYPIAIAVYKKLIQLRPRSADAHLRLAKAYAQQSDFPEALKSNEEAFRLDPKNAAALEGSAAASNGMNQPARAIQFATQAIQLNPKLSEAYDDLCTSYEQLKYQKQAFMACLNAVAIAGSKPAPYVALGTFLFRSGNYPAAMSAFKQADALHAHPLLTLPYEGYIDAKTNHLKESTAAFERCVQLDPSNVKYHGLLAQVYVKTGNKTGVLREKKWLSQLTAQATTASSPTIAPAVKKN